MPMRAERERDCARHSTEPTHTLLTKDVINLRDFWRVTKLNPPHGLVILSRFIGIFISEIETPPCKTTLEN